MSPFVIQKKKIKKTSLTFSFKSSVILSKGFILQGEITARVMEEVLIKKWRSCWEDVQDFVIMSPLWRFPGPSACVRLGTSGCSLLTSEDSPRGWTLKRRWGLAVMLTSVSSTLFKIVNCKCKNPEACCSSQFYIFFIIKCTVLFLCVYLIWIFLYCVQVSI